MRRAMAERGLTFKEAVNAAIIGGLTPRARSSSFTTPTFDLGRAQLSLDRALARAGELEDEELIRKRSMGK